MKTIRVPIDPENLVLLRRAQLVCRYKVSLTRLVNGAISNYGKIVNAPSTKAKHTK